MKRRRMSMVSEFEDYALHANWAMEVCTWYIFHTQKWTGESRMEFFGNLRGPSTVETNMYHDFMLPNPQAFMIEGIKIMGLTTEIKDARARLVITNKIWTDFPAWIYSGMRDKWKEMVPLMIPPLSYFKMDLTWNRHVIPFPAPVITVVLKGKLARPIQ